MKLKYLIIASIFLFSITTKAFALDNSTTITPSNVPGQVFLDWHKENNKIEFDFDMPYGEAGKYLYLYRGSKVVATSSLRMPALSEYKSILLPIPPNGTYIYSATLCKDIFRFYCSKSNIISIVVNNNSIKNEIDLGPDDLGEARSETLNNLNRERLILSLKSSLGRYGESEVDQSSIKPENIERAKNILEKTSLGSVLSNIEGVSLPDFYSLLGRNPRFCGESSEEESLDSACARDLSAYLTYLLTFTNDEVKNEYVGMKNKKLVNDYISNSNSQDITNESNSSTIVELVMKWYMTPSSSEPDPHSALLGLYVPNDVDRISKIEIGFGSTQNIASHGEWCKTSKSSKNKSVLDLYKKLLGKTEFEDIKAVSCEGQSPFGIGSNAFAPVYYTKDDSTGKCSLDVIESKNIIFKKEFYSDCLAGNKKSPLLTKLIEDGFIKIEKIISQTKNSTQISLIKNNVDKRVLYGKKISATYGPERAKTLEGQPSNIPFNKINELIFEGASVTSTGKFDYIDKFVSKDMIFSGDCVRADCEKGLLNQFKQAKKIFPDIRFILSIKIDNLSDLSSSEKRENLSSSTYTFLRENKNFSGVQLSIGDTSNQSRESLRLSMIGLRSVISTLNSEDNINRILSIAIKAKIAKIDSVPLPEISSMIDTIYLLAYDNYGVESATTSHNAQIFSLNSKGDDVSLASALLNLKQKNIPENKIVIGVPFYGRIWNNVPIGNKTDLPGLFESHNTKSENTYIDYSTIVNYLLGRGDYQYYEDTTRGGSYIYDGETLISYDTPEIVEQKMGYIYKDGYKGVLFADIMSDNGSLTERALKVISKGEQKLACSIKRNIKGSIKDGDTNADVFALQSYLRCLGYFPSYIDINGYFGFATKKAIQSFQQDNSIDPTGTVNDKTRMLLQPDVNTKTTTI